MSSVVFLALIAIAFLSGWPFGVSVVNVINNWERADMSESDDDDFSDCDDDYSDDHDEILSPLEQWLEYEETVRDAYNHYRK